MRSWLYSALVGIILLCNSCIDQSDYELDGIQLNPTIALPLVSGQLTINDILKDADSVHIKKYNDGLLYLAYEQELASQGIRELFSIPSQTANRSFIMPGATVPPHTKDIRSDSIISTLNLNLSPEKLTEVALRAGRIGFTTTLNPSSSKLDYEVAIVLPTVKSRTTNQPLNTIIKNTGDIDLSNYTLTLNDNKFDLKLVLIFKKTTTSTTIAPATSINVSLNFGGMEFIHVKGFLGDQTASLDPETVGLTIFDNEVFKQANLSLAQPKVTFTVANENGVPVTVNFKTIEARKPGSAPFKILLNPANPVPLAYPTVMGESKPTTVSVTNLKELLNFAPNELYYHADARINQGLTSGNNFLLDSSDLKVKLNVEVPLWGSASGIVLRDTLDIDMSNTETSQITSASLKLKLINQFPLDGDVQFILTDNDYNVVESLLLPDQTNIIKGSTVDGDGELQAAGAYIGTIQLDKSKIDKLFSARHVILVATMQTSRNASGAAQDVKFMADYFLSVEAGILANIKLNVE
jgi:hypothetical protein